MQSGYTVTRRERPDENGNFGSGLFHVTTPGGDRSLCAHSCDPDAGWDERPDMHPEDVDAMDRCGPCFTTLEARKREARENGDNRWQDCFR